MIKPSRILAASLFMVVCFASSAGAIDRSYNPDRSSNVYGMNNNGLLRNRYYSREHNGYWGISSSRMYGTTYGQGIKRSYFSSPTTKGSGGNRRSSEAARGYRSLSNSEIQAMEEKMYSGKVVP